jgi:hypothetical protein
LTIAGDENFDVVIKNLREYVESRAGSEASNSSSTPPPGTGPSPPPAE